MKVNLGGAYTILEEYKRAGRDVSQLLESVGLTYEQLEEPGETVPYEVKGNLFELAAQELGDPYLGLRLGRMVEMKSWGVHAFLAYASKTLGETLQQKQRLFPLITSAYHVDICEDDGNVCVELVPQKKSFVAFGQLAMFGDAASVRHYRKLTGEHITPVLVTFPHKVNGNVREYENYFGCPVLFEHRKDSVVYARETFDLPIATHDSGLMAILLKHAENQLAKSPRQRESTAHQVERVVVEFLATGNVAIKFVARKLGMSERTLARRLDEEGVSFKGIVNGVRQELSMKYLRDPKLSLIDTAFLLGYSTQSAFNTAFKRWTGKTPKEYLN